MWSVRIQGMDISMGNWIRRPMVSSRKNSLNHNWDRSQHCCRASDQQKHSRERNSNKPSNWTESIWSDLKRLLKQTNQYYVCTTDKLLQIYVEIFSSPLKLSKCVKKKECLWKSSMATTMGPSRQLRRVFLDPLLSAISDSSMVRTIYSCRGQEARITC